MPSNKKTEFREAVKGVKATDKIRRKGLHHLMKTVIQPIRGQTMPPIVEQIIESKKKKKIAKIAKENELIAKEQKLHKKRVGKMTKGGFNLPQPKTPEAPPPIPPSDQSPPPIPPSATRNRKTDLVREEKESKQDPGSEMDRKKIVELRAIAKSMKVKSYSTMNKAQLLISIKDALKQPLLYPPLKRRSKSVDFKEKSKKRLDDFGI